ncbi:hypothetical protein SAMN04488061_0904 [Filomicrobium insigne]|uniref:Intracellular septation protein A n=1 Tax=Filomicrobium insigne TaxID=418854 RepID=A0A1H0IN67_9HYPH|nr:hypothetical protein [Filomicrobium insigne]SDO32828.1 hypothetical protein SAMN04488061_0904 [Filomicrobium insigne]
MAWAIWIVALTIGLAAILWSAANVAPEMHTLACALVAASVAATAILDNRSLYRRAATKHRIAASTATYMGLVWTWGAIGLFTTYTPMLDILRWKEWLVFTLAFAGVAVLCLGFAWVIASDEKRDSGEQTMLNLAQYLSVGQLVGMGIAALGLIIDGKFPVTVKKQIEWQDWAANNIFFFGALALAAITANALYMTRQQSKQETVTS